jgi:hypothetical protein
MVPPIKRPILPIVISVSPNSKEPLTTPECIALINYHDCNQVFDYQYYLYHEDGRSALHPAHVFQHLDKYCVLVPFLPVARSWFRGNASPTPKSRSTIAMSEKLFSIYVSFIRENGPEGSTRMQTTRNPRIMGCLKM